MNTRKETNYIQQTIGRDSGRTPLHFKQTVLDVRGSSQSKKKWLTRSCNNVRVTLLAEPTLVRPARQLCQCETISACASVVVSSWLGKRSELSFHINSRLSLLGYEAEPLSRENLSLYKSWYDISPFTYTTYKY